jgi:hypothetical protein
MRVGPYRRWVRRHGVVLFACLAVVFALLSVAFFVQDAVRLGVIMAGMVVVQVVMAWNVRSELGRG